MSYQVNARRIEPGTYELSYGRGSKRLATKATEADGSWTTEHPHFAGDRLRDVKQTWGAWAEAVYNLPAKPAAVAQAAKDAGFSIAPPPEPAEPGGEVMTWPAFAEAVLSWALRNGRNPSLPPWSDAIRLLRREGVDVDVIFKQHGRAAAAPAGAAC